jgi:predicted transcriptional regulator of viral defense system
MKTMEFFATHPVFSLDEAAKTLAPPGGRAGTVERLKHHLATGRLTLPTRAVYAVVPPGVPASRFRPDPFLVAAAARPDAVFSHHSALELLGAAHTAWTRTTLYTRRRRRSLALKGGTVCFLDHPAPLGTGSGQRLGTRRIERRGRLLDVTGPERTIVEGFHRPAQAGGLLELVQSASGFPTLDLELIETVLRRYGVAHLWAATGWFLERFRQTFHVPEGLLDRCERHRPRSPQYLERRRRGGTLAARWSLILPRRLAQPGEPDEP